MAFGGNTNGFRDTKDFRICVLNTANDRLGLLVKSTSEGNGTQISRDTGLINLLDSTYKSDVPSTIYAMHLKAMAFESARFLCSTSQVVDDLIFDSTRGEYISQNLASFLFPDNRFASTTSSDVKVRNFYLAIIEAYFGGSTKSNIQNALIKFLEGIPIQIIENFLLSRENPSLDAIIRQFTFDVVINVDDPRIKDLTQLQEDVQFLVGIIKPAHTFYETKFLFSELLDTFGKGCTTIEDASGNAIITHDGFETKIKNQSTSLCDTFHIDTFDYFYEDLRKLCGQTFVVPVVNENISDQASPRIVESLVGGSWEESSPYVYHVRYGPLGNSEGFLATSISDVTVYVDGVPVEVIQVFALSGAVELAAIPPEGSVVTIDYYFLKEYINALTTNDVDSVLNNWRNSATEFNYKSVLWPTNYTPLSKEPLETEYKYQGFDLFNSSVLNSPESLNFNELGLRNRLNDYDVFKSYGYDSDIYNTALFENTPLVPVSLDKKDFWRRLSFQEFRLNLEEFTMNTYDDRMFGEIHYEALHPFYAGLELMTRDNGGETGFLSSICEDPKAGMTLNFERIFEETIAEIGPDYDCQLYTYTPCSTAVPCCGFSILTDECSVLNSVCCALGVGSATWTFDPGWSGFSAQFGGNFSQMHLLINDVVEENYELGPEYSWNDKLPVSGFSPANNSYGWIDEINDFSEEYYREVPWITTNAGNVLGATGWYLWGSKLKEADIEVNYIGEDYTLGYFTLNHTVVAGERVLIVNDSSYLKFLSPIKKIGNTVTKVRNVTKGMDYELTNINIINYSIIDLDESLPANISIGIDPGDVIEADFVGIDNMNPYEELVGIVDAATMGFQMPKDITQITEIVNYTKDPTGTTSSYDLTNATITFNNFVDLDESLPTNIAIGLDPGDDVFATFTTVDPVDRIEPHLNEESIYTVTTQITITPV